MSDTFTPSKPEDITPAMLEEFEALYRAEIAKYPQYEDWADAHTDFDIYYGLIEQAGYIFAPEDTTPPDAFEAIMDKVDMEVFGRKTSDEY